MYLEIALKDAANKQREAYRSTSRGWVKYSQLRKLQHAFDCIWIDRQKNIIFHIGDALQLWWFTAN